MTGFSPQLNTTMRLWKGADTHMRSTAQGLQIRTDYILCHRAAVVIYHSEKETPNVLGVDPLLLKEFTQ